MIYEMYNFNYLKLIVEDSQKKIYLDCIQLKALFNEIRPEGECEACYHLFYEKLILNGKIDKKIIFDWLNLPSDTVVVFSNVSLRTKLYVNSFYLTKYINTVTEYNTI